MNRYPRFRRDLVVVEQTYRGERSYVVKDPTEHKYYRFRALEIAVMQEFDGERSPADVAAALAEAGVTLGPASVEAFGRKLAQMGLMERTLAEKSVLLVERLRADRKRRLAPAYRGTLLRMRWSVGDPDAWLGRTLPRIRFMFTPGFVAFSIVMFLVYAAIVVTGWPELHTTLAAIYTPSQYTWGFVLTFYLTAIGIIGIHELGHAYTCKYFGGSVHELGAMLIYFEPAFYCNVNDSWTFPELRQRMWVTAAGSWIQMLLAAVAAIIWLLTTPGTLVHEVAAAAVLIGGLTTVVANANPLIPLDGYYALSDWLEISNLRQRSFGHLAWLVKRKLLGLQVPEPAATPRERRVFLVYAGLATLYILSIFFLVGGLVLGWFSAALGALGVILFLAGVFAISRNALRAGVQHALTSVKEHRDRWRTTRFRRRLLATLALLVLIGLIPWPITTRGGFRAAPIRSGSVVARDAGVVVRVHASEGLEVAAGAPIAELRNPRLEREAADERRLADSLDLQAYRARARGAAGEARALEAERDESRARLTGLHERLDGLVLRAPISGIVATARLEETIGLHLPQGGVYAVVVAADSVDLRVSLHGAGAALVRPGQRTRLVSYANVARPLRTAVTAVGTAADSTGGRAVEARIRVPTFAGWWRPGVTGEAEVVLSRGTIATALWWSVRSRIRRDLLL